ncbi:MAG: alkaline phosphatase family protein, partial [Deltaproteobacteria bacterium]|nr:alkaline phosphatase family protein [Deltaproteobacteria bacterium]
GIFDFVGRDLANGHPVTTTSRPLDPDDVPAALHLGGYVFPLGSADLLPNRSGTALWDVLAEAGVDVEVYRIPANYPPTPSRAKVLSGMGVPDLRGGYGVYTWITDERPSNADTMKGDVQVVTVQDTDLDGTPDTVVTTLKGAPDVFHLEPGALPGPEDYLRSRVTFVLDPLEDVLLVRTDWGEAVVREGEWSPWMELVFEGLPLGLADFSGGVRFYAKEIRPSFRIYASPVNLWAADPAQSFSTPDEGFAEEVEARIGPYYTQGLPEEVNALKDGTLTDEEYLSEVALVQAETLAMLDMALERLDPGDFSFVYMSDLDLQCHMLWRYGDPKHPDAPPHPARPADPERLAGIVERFYGHIDNVLAGLRPRLPDDVLLVIMSDHGFESQTWNVHVNAWLRDQGYLVLKDGKRTGQIAADDVDWSRTRAYNIGFNGVYLNLKDREAHGIVPPDEAPALAREIADRMEAWINEETGAHVIRRAFLASEAYTGPRLPEAPDIVVGFDREYAGSDESTLGEVTEDVLELNTSPWSGNHLMAPEVVPGVLLLDRPIGGEGWDLSDLAPTILNWYGIPVPPEMTGQAIPVL